jgi:hypothetical protein
VLTDVKAWLATAGHPVAQDSFAKPPKPPYIVFIEGTDMRGADSRNCIAERTINLELYAEAVDVAAEMAIENLLNARPVEYSKERIWISSERYFQTVYEINLVEKT